MMAVHLRPILGVFDSLRRNFFRAPDSFRGQLECPCQDQRDWKTEKHSGNKHLHYPRRRFECGEENGSRLDQQPRHDRVRDRDPVNLAPLQLGEKRSRIHDNGGNVSATRFLCTNGDTDFDGMRAVQAMNEERPHEFLSVTVQKIFVNVIENPNRN